jgi:diguanylate cyclase (GGDEF)-like protein
VQIEHQAFHDALTALPNRTLFHDRVEQALRHAPRERSCVAVMVMDLDRLKEVNDTLGHESGDRLLVEVGQNLLRPLRAADTVARLGGDEFGVLAPDLACADDALALAERLRDAVGEPQRIAGLEVEVDASIGIALFPRDGEDVETLLRRADIASTASRRPTCAAAACAASRRSCAGSTRSSACSAPTASCRSPSTPD